MSTFIEKNYDSLGYIGELPPNGDGFSLNEKLIPVVEREKIPKDGEHFVQTRGLIDVSKFKEFLNELPPEAWEDENSNEENVKLVRPAHDAWGIKKIVFNFCDDFLLKVLDLPFATNPKWTKHLDPIYKAIGIDKNRIVRSLLASMPPGMSIPVHHDTGFWVKHTHRLHVAIDSGIEVDFSVGPSNDRLTKYIFDEGRIVELNNQAKHSVTNNMINKRRIHLIFDYVDEGYPLQRYTLQPGEKVYQTRRSIDLPIHAGSRRTPSFIILGSQKCGTTSVYEYICQHPLVVRGKRRETHYFDWRWNHSLPSDDAEKHRNYYLNFYDEANLFKHSSLITGESTPSYLLHSDIVIPRIQMVCPWVKLIVIFRNPTERAFSQYQMCIDTSGSPEQLKVRGRSSYIGKTFEEVIKTEIEELNNAGINKDCTYETFRDNILSKCPLTHGGHSIVSRGLYALQLEPWMKALPKDQLMVMSISDIKGSKTNVQESMDKVFEHIGIPPSELPDVDAKNTRNYTPMSEEATQMLNEFYEPFNKRLFSLVQKNLW
jgi:hypothetical protein